MTRKEKILATEKLTEKQKLIIVGIDEGGKETFFHTTMYGTEATPNPDGGYGGVTHVSAIRGLEARGLITANHMWRGATCRLT
jgi:hypothetical protein